MNEPSAILSTAGETIHGTVHSKELCTLTESIAYADTRTVREMGLEPNGNVSTVVEMLENSRFWGYWDYRNMPELCKMFPKCSQKAWSGIRVFRTLEKALKDAEANGAAGNGRASAHET